MKGQEGRVVSEGMRFTTAAFDLDFCVHSSPRECLLAANMRAHANTHSCAACTFAREIPP